MLQLQLQGKLRQHLTKDQLLMQWDSFVSELSERQQRKRDLELELRDEKEVLEMLCRRRGTLRQVRRCSCYVCAETKEELNLLAKKISDGAEAVRAVEAICNMYCELWRKSEISRSPKPAEKPDNASMSSIGPKGVAPSSGWRSRKLGSYQSGPSHGRRRTGK